MTKVLICNAGSTSLKFKLFEMPRETVLAAAVMERIGGRNGGRYKFEAGEEVLDIPDQRIGTYVEGIHLFLESLAKSGILTDLNDLAAVGFKTVAARGFYGTHVIDEQVIQGMKDYLTIAPAHNQHYLNVIGAFREILPDVPLIGAFETEFHQTIPPEAYVYSVPYEWYEQYQVRRLGYHGASHSYVAGVLTSILGDHYHAVCCHLGGSGSICAVKDGKSVDTSFGMSLQAGIPQSNRCGDLDPYIPLYLIRNCGLSPQEVETRLTSDSGFLGLTGADKDLRDILAKQEQGDPRAKLAVDIFIHDTVKYIAGFAGILGGLDAITFAGGIGENSTYIRNRVLTQLAFLGIELSASEQAEETYRVLTTPESRIAVYVIPTNEELVVARKAWQALSAV